MQLILISGVSGSGKSIALKVLEDAGYYCVDNLPVTLLPQLVSHLRAAGYAKVGVAADVRSGASIAAMPQVANSLRGMVEDVRFLFLDARDDALVARFSETRRRHPLSDDGVTLEEAIARERELLSRIGELGHRIDTSELHPNSLRNWVKDLLQGDAERGLTLLFESFGFKHGIPVDADFVFDVRVLPNPYYDPALRPLTGRDEPVIAFLQKTPEVLRMYEDIRDFVGRWLPSFVRDGRSYLTVGIGCTGGQHRSVYLAESLAAHFRASTRVLVRHRSLR
ncbi:MAG: RNase adapter RapZ [Moraxellaceae bacterium]|nr:RNase adapter RapZ [Moraxellaceae bacterium]